MASYDVQLRGRGKPRWHSAVGCSTERPLTARLPHKPAPSRSTSHSNTWAEVGRDYVPSSPWAEGALPYTMPTPPGQTPSLAPALASMRGGGYSCPPRQHPPSQTVPKPATPRTTRTLRCNGNFFRAPMLGPGTAAPLTHRARVSPSTPRAPSTWGFYSEPINAEGNVLGIQERASIQGDNLDSHFFRSNRGDSPSQLPYLCSSVRQPFKGSRC